MSKSTHNPAAPRATLWNNAYQHSVDGASLAVFRILFGVIALWEVARYFYTGGIRDFFITPGFHFGYYGFEWVTPWPGDGMYLHFLGLGVAATLVTIGLWYRAAMIVLAIGWTYVLLLEKAAYLNHIYLVCLVTTLMIFLPADRIWSWKSRLHPGAATQTIPAWCLWAVRTQIAIPYVCGGIVKLNSDWLNGAPMQLWMAQMTDLRATVPLFGERWFAIVFSVCGLLLDLLIVPLLLWPRTRKFAFAAALTFHLMNAAMFHIGIFPWFMICATSLFLAPDWPRRFLKKQAASPNASRASTTSLSNGKEKLVVACLAVWFGAQLLLPFRHYLYEGDVDWTEEGGRFAWRMMLHDKWAALRFILTDPKTGKKGPFDPRQYLSMRQINKMSYDPEMLRVFAHFIASEASKAGHEGVEVRAEVHCSMNGRRPQLLIDPTVNLAAEPARWTHQPWITQLKEPLPDQPWIPPAHMGGPQRDPLSRN